MLAVCRGPEDSSECQGTCSGNLRLHRKHELARVDAYVQTPHMTASIMLEEYVAGQYRGLVRAFMHVCAMRWACYSWKGSSGKRGGGARIYLSLVLVGWNGTSEIQQLPGAFSSRVSRSVMEDTKAAK